MGEIIKSEFGWVEVNGVNIQTALSSTRMGGSQRGRKKSKDLRPIYGGHRRYRNVNGFLSEEKPDVVYIGIGHQAALPITPEAIMMLEKYETVILPTKEITEKISQERRKMVALIHVTC